VTAPSARADDLLVELGRAAYLNAQVTRCSRARRVYLRILELAVEHASNWALAHPRERPMKEA
jgi:hypothetical protein